MFSLEMFDVLLGCTKVTDVVLCLCLGAPDMYRSWAEELRAETTHRAVLNLNR